MKSSETVIAMEGPTDENLTSVTEVTLSFTQ